VPERRQQRSEGRVIDQKGARRDAGPDPAAEHEQSRERDTSRGPNRRRARMDECDRQTELARDGVDERENGNDEQRVRLLLSLLVVVTEGCRAAKQSAPLDPPVPPIIV